MVDNKAIIIAGTQSGSGKTTVTLGLMAALSGIGHTVQPFKCGPDFIDPTLHRLVTGKESRNLDIWMSGERFTNETFFVHSSDADISIIEGVMGMYDGGDSSSASLAAKLGIPIVLVIDVRAAAESAAAVLKGFESLMPEVAPVGVILNRVASPRHLQLVTDAINKYCRAEILGYLPSSLNFSIPERHLGLHMGEEAPISQEAIKDLAETVAEHVDLEKLMTLATVREKKTFPVNKFVGNGNVRIGVAWDKAFCFYYEDNLDLLRQAGAELIFFSPLVDECLPEGIGAIYLGGGYPELWAEALSENRKMLAAIKAWGENDGFLYAECGGFMYLTNGITLHDGSFHPMANVFPVRSQMQKRRASLGYREIKLKEQCCLGPVGTVLRGHEFHYSSIDTMPTEIPRIYSVNNGKEEGYRYKNVLGGYLHLHFGFQPEVAVSFVSCSEERR